MIVMRMHIARNLACSNIINRTSQNPWYGWFGWCITYKITSQEIIHMIFQQDGKGDTWLPTPWGKTSVDNLQQHNMEGT